MLKDKHMEEVEEADGQTDLKVEIFIQTFFSKSHLELCRITNFAYRLDIS